MKEISTKAKECVEQIQEDLRLATEEKTIVDVQLAELDENVRRLVHLINQFVPYLMSSMVLEQKECEGVLGQLETRRVEQLAAIDKNMAETDQKIELVLSTEKGVKVRIHENVQRIITCKFRRVCWRKSKK